MAQACAGEPGVEPRVPERLGDARPRRSRAARWRALVLVLVHVAIALHVGHWLAEGRTLSPLEPSEGMQFTQQGLVNAGFVLFLLAILSTALLGRFFCGWTCHLVALQDLCHHLLGKVGVRPKPVALGPLVAVPWLAFVYMFLAPLAWRWLADVPLPATRVDLSTEGFWDTFPGPWVAIVTLLVCGFGLVYLLGAKGFCTYACPYGGIFGVADQLAPVRIRVDDTCQGCGHCTSACTSNVVVHQEVRDWGMVVDPGCMKCLDCVSVCPTGSLRVGAGVPALFARRRRGAAPRVSGGSLRASGRTLVLALFVPSALALLTAFDGRLDVGLVLALSVFSLSVAAVFRGRSQRAASTTLVEDLLLALLFLAGLWTFRGWRGLVPLLFSLGLATLLAWVGLLLWRLVARRRVLAQAFVLRSEGRLTPAGRAFVAVALPLVLLSGSLGWQRVAEARRARASSARTHAAVLHGLAGRFAEAEAEFRAALELEPQNLEARVGLAGALCELGRFREGAAEYERALERAPEASETRRLAALAWEAAGELEAAARHRAELAARAAAHR